MIIFCGRKTRFCLDRLAGQLWKGDCGQEKIHLPRKEWEVLLYLAERPGDLVTKPELQDNIWGLDDTTVAETSVTQAISKIRRAIEDLPKTPTVIETVQGRGYRFIAKIESPQHDSHRRTGRASLDQYATVPPLPLTFLDRPEITDSLQEDLIHGSGSILGITALEGMGGVGKTLIAISLCHRPQVRHAFPDGIIWLTIGRDSTLTFSERVEFIARALTTDIASYSAVEYQSLLREKALLVVLDDVWAVADIEPFRVSCGRSRLLYTSRDRTLAGPLGADSREVGMLETKQARYFLSRWSGREGTPPPEPFTSAILDECKGLALGLAMIGAALKGQPDSEWESTLTDLRQMRLKDVGFRPAGYAYETLHASIAVSVNALPNDTKYRYLQLAVFQEDMSLSLILLRQLWGGDERNVRRTCRLLADRSLFRRDTEGFRLHALQLDYICGEYPYQDALAKQKAALLLSSHIVRAHPEQFASQMIGRLLIHQQHQGVSMFLERLDLCAPRPRFRPLRSGLISSGGLARRILKVYSSLVMFLSITADGKHAISGLSDGTLRLWDLDSNAPPQDFGKHSDRIVGVAISADGSRAISASKDEIVVWNLYERSQQPRKLQGLSDIRALAMAADGSRAVSASKDEILVWNLNEPQPNPRKLQGFSYITSLAMTADGKRAIANGRLVVDLDSNESSWESKHYWGWADHVSLTADGKRAIIADSNELLVWDLVGDQPPRKLKGHSKTIEVVVMTADGRRAISGSGDNTLLVWDLVGNQPPYKLESYHGFASRPMFRVAVTPDGRRAISTSEEAMLRVWDLDIDHPRQDSEGHAGEIVAMAVGTAISADGHRAVVRSREGMLGIWDVNGNDPPRRVKGQCFTSIALTADGQRAVCGSMTGIWTWDLDGDEPPQPMNGYSGNVYAIAITADGKRAIFISSEGSLWVWDLVTHQLPRKLEEGEFTQASWAAITADGRRAAAKSPSSFQIWDLEGYQRIRTVDNHVSLMALSNAAAITADGTRAIFPSFQHLWVWDLDEDESPKQLGDFSGGIIQAAAITSDGKRGFFGSDRGTLQVWDIDRAQRLATFSCDFGVLSCACSNGLIVVVDRGGRLHRLAWEE